MAALECPRCTYSIPYQTKIGCSYLIPEPASWANHDDIHTLQAEAQSLDDLMSHLKQKRATVLRKINSLQAKTRNLPPEVLSVIFQNARPPIDFDTPHTDLNIGSKKYRPKRDFHHTLASVSSVWRLAALSTPQLWTTIALRVHDRRPIKNITSLLNLHVRRARSIPITVELDFRDASELWDRPAEAACIEFSSLLEPLESAVFVQNAATIGHLILLDPPSEWLSSRNGNLLSQCHSLGILQKYRRDYTIDLTQLPCLKRVQVIEYPLVLSLPETVTTIHFRELASGWSLTSPEIFPQASELHFVECSAGVVTFALRAIARHLYLSDLRQQGVNGTAESPEVLPKLCKLFITHKTAHGKVEGEEIATMLKLLYNMRRNRGRFRLVVEPESFWDHGERVLEKLKGLVREGFDLEVVTGSQRLDLS